MKIGFIGLGNVGFKLANSIIESGFELLINDLDKNAGKSLIEKGAKWMETPKELSKNFRYFNNMSSKPNCRCKCFRRTGWIN